MGLWEAVSGRSTPKRPNLDALFAIPSAAITLEAAAGFRPTGLGTVCFRIGPGAAMAQVQADVRALLDDDPEVPDDVEFTADEYGYTWLVVRRDPEGGLPGLCTDLHAVNTTLELAGFETGLLCTMVPFADQAGRRFGLVYLYKQGTYYAFAPVGGAPTPAATICWRSRCVTSSRASCPWSPISAAGSRSGAPPDSDPDPAQPRRSGRTSR
ncbi:MAG: hypothetical protein R2731_16550 [Nocardioides sp.]